MPIRLHRIERKPSTQRIDALSPDELMAIVRALSYPRPCSNIEANSRARDWIAKRLRDDGYDVVEQGRHRNLLAFPDGSGPFVIVGAHYDSVEGTPGADDNASAVAVMLGLARALRGKRIGWVAWNAEEDGIIGSEDFARWAKSNRIPIKGAHVLEMLGFCNHAEGSQQFPPGILSRLPVPNVADFIGLLANHHSRQMMARIADEARRATDVRVVGLQTYFGVEKRLPSLDLSDHVRLWAEGIPAVLWTDTAFYRNPHYHMPSDTPDTLDPAFMSGVAHLIYRVLS